MKRALVLDDDGTVLHILSRHLRLLGLNVIACRELEAAEAVMEHTAVDLLITDLCLSPLGGLDGVRLIQHLAAQYPQTRLIAVSGHVTPQIADLCRKLGTTAVFEKPVNLEHLTRHLDYELGPLAPPAGQEGSFREMESLAEFLAAESVHSVLQPIVSLRRNAPPFDVLGVESLARGPEGSLLRNPELLFAYASRKDLLYETDMLCIRAALAEARRLEGAGMLFINMQPRSLTNPNFALEVADLVGAAGLPVGRIVFELTEQQTILNPRAFAATLSQLRRHGFKVALDDYGVGFSSLQLILDLRPDYLKISGYFCRDLHSDRTKQTLVGATTAMAFGLGIPTIIEAVETAEERDMAQALGADFAQGYFFARPAPARDLALSGRFSGFAPPVPALA